MKVYAMTEKGNHVENEDRILINENIISAGSFETECDSIRLCIADGVGGNNAGAIASSFVCECLKDVVSVQKSVLFDINKQLLKKSVENASYSEMATTLSGLCLDCNGANLFHVGNTRIYILRGSYIRQITEDQTSVNWLIKTGKISIKEAETYDKRNEITGCFGGGNPILINSLVFEENNEALLNSKRIILTSDGIHEYVSDDELENSMRNAGADVLQTCMEIINIAKTNGSTDDKSIVILDM